MSAMDILASYELLTSQQITNASDDQIAHTIAVLIDEQKQRSLANRELDAIADDAFTTWAFDRAGRAQDPQLRDGLLICPGYKYEKSAASHDCTFVSIDGTWIWEHPELAYDEMRAAAGSKTIRQTISIIPAYHGLTFDVVTSSARSGPCHMKKAHSYRVDGNALVETQRRVRTSGENR